MNPNEVIHDGISRSSLSFGRLRPGKGEETGEGGAGGMQEGEEGYYVVGRVPGYNRGGTGVCVRRMFFCALTFEDLLLCVEVDQLSLHIPTTQTNARVPIDHRAQRRARHLELCRRLRAPPPPPPPPPSLRGDPTSRRGQWRCDRMRSHSHSLHLRSHRDPPPRTVLDAPRPKTPSAIRRPHFAPHLWRARRRGRGAEWVEMTSHLPDLPCYAPAQRGGARIALLRSRAQRQPSALCVSRRRLDPSRRGRRQREVPGCRERIPRPRESDGSASIDPCRRPRGSRRVDGRPWIEVTRGLG